MGKERAKRRGLYVVTVLGWVVAGAFAWLDVEWGASLSIARAGLIFGVAVAATLTNVTLFAVLVTPLEGVYRHGYEAGLHSCQHPVKLVMGDRRGTVVPLRAATSGTLD